MPTATVDRSSLDTDQVLLESVDAAVDHRSNPSVALAAAVLGFFIVTFDAGASNENGLPLCYQWRRDGADIAGANGPTYSFGPVSISDSGAHFDCQVAVIGSSTVTRSALLTVTQLRSYQCSPART